MLMMRYPPRAPSMGVKYAASGWSSSTTDWKADMKLPSFIAAFPSSGGTRNVSMKRIAYLLLSDPPIESRRDTLSTVLMMPPAPARRELPRISLLGGWVNKAKKGRGRWPQPHRTCASVDLAEDEDLALGVPVDGVG